MGPEKLPIPAAQLISSRDHLVPGQLLVTELFFRVPLDYKRPSGVSITLFGRRVVKSSGAPADDGDGNDNGNSDKKRYLVYLEGGPGFGNSEPQVHPVTRMALAKGYQVLLLDHRGTGLSTPVSAESLDRIASDNVSAQADYLKLMRQDNTVRDLESVRLCLTAGWSESRARWSIFGQSYGGFVSMSYLSMHPEGLEEVFLTGGLAPVGKTPDQVYSALFPRIVRRNEEYYHKFPEDVAAVRQVAAHIESHGGHVALPSGGILTVPRLLTLGINFGFHGGFDSVHTTILRLKASLDQLGFLSRAALAPLETGTPLDFNIIYAIIHEAIYCDGPGVASNWAAYRVGRDNPCFPWLRPDALPITVTTNNNPGEQGQQQQQQTPLYFSGENIFPFHFVTYPELSKLHAVAERLAAFDNWPALYNKEQLANNQVPVYAASFIHDMYVDFDFARDTASLVRGTKVFETNVMYHSALRAKSDEVLQQLFNLRDDVLD
ncbi:alpha/beta hydrolase fold [Geosmithia morbida]|uniref:Alpha/beta hydrolase fold n=1 Tax=Geosmithia morbida TaxID=1094350 RepID=A0A9P5D6I9_9HYPO|nr:alpha/beta hydrolase fold [Geosmithia morbida]KAF4123559.1 alpha/beta hydrolase fold [Geosmithia morbida]